MKFLKENRNSAFKITRIYLAYYLNSAVKRYEKASVVFIEFEIKNVQIYIIIEILKWEDGRDFKMSRFRKFLNYMTSKCKNNKNINPYI